MMNLFVFVFVLLFIFMCLVLFAALALKMRSSTLQGTRSRIIVGGRQILGQVFLFLDDAESLSMSSTGNVIYAELGDAVELPVTDHVRGLPPYSSIALLLLLGCCFLLV